MTVSLLLPFDGSPAATRALDLVTGYAGDKSTLEVSALNVQSRPLALWPVAGVDPLAIDSALLESGRQALEPALLRLGAAGVAARAEVQLGHPSESIVRAAHGHDAIVMGTRGGGALRGYGLGSVALRVAHGAHAPVLLLKPDDRLPPAMGRQLRVLLAMDGSPPALRAAELLAASRAWLGRLEVHLAWVQRPLTVLEAVLPPHQDLVEQWSTAEGEEAMRAARALFTREGIAHKLHYTVGDPSLEVRTLAEEVGAELVALGTRGRGAAHHALVGSVALSAAVHCDVPVMLVP